MSSYVWVQLYYDYEGTDEPELDGEPHKIPTSAVVDVADLKEAAKAKLKIELDHAGLTKLYVYSPGTTSFSQDKVLKAWNPIPSNSSGPQPFMVMAPNPKQANGEKH